MSGGFFDYNQYRLDDMVDSIERELEQQGKELSKDELWYDFEFYEKFPEEKYYQTYPIEIQEKMKEAIKYLKIAKIYVHRLDWYLSGDDGEESFIERLKNDLNEIK